ncbi:MAG: hypothetical protein JST17_00170 [Bacteroidetes bacterium]|nr:hypothetical protein [Bacteroidota bacterium]MBS1932230.1 hypothetical protein [Bacteroidota bacterium]
MKKIFLSNKLFIIGMATGALGGYLYYCFIGCTTGTCPITSRPLNSTLYGAVMGGLLFSLFKKGTTPSQKNKKQQE